MLNFVLIFLGGIFSFFSPCILPLLPVYLGYLAGNSKDENIKRKNLIFNTFCFALGIATSFFILGISFSTLGVFLTEHKVLFAKISGVIIIILALFQLGILNFNFLQREKRLDIEFKKINPFVAYITGFTFSFAWTPCVGPTLSAILLMASNIGTTNRALSLFYIAIYSLGFIVPFIAVGFFSTFILDFIKKNRNVFKYTIKISGIILLILGILTFSGYFSKEPEKKNIDVMELKLTDQFGKTHTLKEYKDKIVFLNFWASWCPPCKEELPEIQKSYEEFGKNSKDIIFIGVVNPKGSQENSIDNKTKEELLKFINERNLTYPILFDTTGEFVNSFRIDVLPTTYLLKNKTVLEYIQGAVNENQIKYIIEKQKN